LQLMTPRASLTPQLAAKALASWWEIAGLEPFDLDGAIRASELASRRVSVLPETKANATPPSTRALAAAPRKPTDSLADAKRLASACTTIDGLEKAMAGFEGCGLKSHARNMVFGGGKLGAPVMIIGEAPDRFDDEVGAPFSGPSGELLDKMLASVGLSRQSNCYLAAMLPWRPPGDRKPTSEEIALCQPFLERHIELAEPKAILMVGGLCAQTLLGVGESVMRLRNRSFKLGISGEIYAQCLLSPAYLLNRPLEKALVWRDLLRFEEEISVRGVAIAR
jgi:uracil-DNA glycosylase